MVLRHSLWLRLLAFASLLWVCPSTGAGDNYVGVYQCASLVVNGRSGRCTSPPLLRGRQIVFEFTYRGKKHKVTFRRSDPLRCVRQSSEPLAPTSPLADDLVAHTSIGGRPIILGSLLVEKN